MKNLKTILKIIFVLSCYSLSAQDSTITFKFSNPQIISGTPDTFQFDVQIKCNASDTYHRDMQIYFNYNTDAFGSNIVSNGRFQYEKIGLMAEKYLGAIDKYKIVNHSDNTSSRIGIITEPLFDGEDPDTDPEYFTEVPTSFDNFFRFKIAIFDNTELAGINFQESLMNGGQYCQGNGVPVLYPDPSAYENDLLNEPTWEPASLTTWNGNENTSWADHDNWTDNIPWSTSNATIPDVGAGNIPIIQDMAECNNLTLNPGGKLTVNSGSQLTVNGNLLLETDASGVASLVDKGTLNVTGSTNIELFLTSNVWHYVSSPVSNALSGVFTGIWLKYFNEPSNDWTYIEPVDIPLNQGQGYAEWTTSDITVNFNGIMNDGNITPSLSFTDNDPHGFNFVGNPYPSYLDWDLIPSANKFNLDASIYAWNGSTYLAYNGSIGGFTDGIIPPMQGFFVHANSASPALTFSNDAKVHSDQSFYKSHYEVSDLISLRVDGNGYFDETYINFNPAASFEFDSDFDAYKLFGIEEAPQIYSVFDDILFSINVSPEITANLEIPVGFSPGKNGEFTITAKDINTFVSDVPINLKDDLTNDIIDLRIDSVYTFSADTNDATDRFRLLFYEPTFVDENENSSGFIIYSSGKDIFIENERNVSEDYLMEVADMAGNIIFRQELPKQSKVKYTLDISSGYYMVRLTSDSKIESRKILIY